MADNGIYVYELLEGCLTENLFAVRCFSRNNVVGILSLGTPVTVTSRFMKFADKRMWRKILLNVNDH